jgi:hypothetical protein
MTTLPHASVSAISYHAQVLEACDSIATSDAQRAHGGDGRLYTSTVAGDEQVAAVLQATRVLDRWAVDPR